jgi:hypothetical protein
LGRWTSGLFVLVRWYCIETRVQVLNVTDVTNVATNTNALVVDVCDVRCEVCVSARTSECVHGVCG